MKIEVNIEKKYAYGILALLLILVGVVAVNAFNTNEPSKFGHSVSEMDWSGEISRINVSEICIRGVCKSAWSGLCPEGYQIKEVYTNHNEDIYGSLANGVYDNIAGTGTNPLDTCDGDRVALYSSCPVDVEKNCQDVTEYIYNSAQGKTYYKYRSINCKKAKTFQCVIEGSI